MNYKNKTEQEKLDLEVAYMAGWRASQDLLLKMLIENVADSKDVPKDVKKKVTSWLKNMSKQLKAMK